MEDEMILYVRTDVIKESCVLSLNKLSVEKVETQNLVSVSCSCK